MDADQRRYAHARSKFIGFVLDPAKELLDATAHLVNAAKVRAEEAEKMMEQMRPHWAQGYTSVSMVAQASTSALSELWELLQVDNQTAAVEKLTKLIETNAQ